MGQPAQSWQGIFLLEIYPKMCRHCFKNLSDVFHTGKRKMCKHSLYVRDAQQRKFCGNASISSKGSANGSDEFLKGPRSW